MCRRRDAQRPGMSLDTTLQDLWYARRHRWLLPALLPLSLLFALLVRLRRALYRHGWLRTHRVGRPVIVVGNLTVGGTGKTPFVIWLARQLEARGTRVGIVLRGYGGAARDWPREVTAQSSSEAVGDEAVLLAQRAGTIVVAGPDRVAAARRAIELGAQVVLSDDGLQHYRLARDCEIAVVDAARGFGNGLPLPAGPLREPRARLAAAHLIVLTQRGASTDAGAGAQWPGAAPRIAVRATLEEAVSLRTGERRPLAAFRGRVVHAVAGVGNPQPFFAALAAAGLQVDARALPDHARIRREDIEFPDRAPVLMTEKDAIKCRGLADERHWAVGLALQIDEPEAERVLAIVDAALRTHA